MAIIIRFLSKLLFHIYLDLFNFIANFFINVEMIRLLINNLIFTSLRAVEEQQGSSFRQS